MVNFGGAFWMSIRVPKNMYAHVSYIRENFVLDMSYKFEKQCTGHVL